MQGQDLFVHSVCSQTPLGTPCSHSRPDRLVGRKGAWVSSCRCWLLSPYVSQKSLGISDLGSSACEGGDGLDFWCYGSRTSGELPGSLGEALSALQGWGDVTRSYGGEVRSPWWHLPFPEASMSTVEACRKKDTVQKRWKDEGKASNLVQAERLSWDTASSSTCERMQRCVVWTTESGVMGVMSPSWWPERLSAGHHVKAAGRRVRLRVAASCLVPLRFCLLSTASWGPALKTQLGNGEARRARALPSPRAAREGSCHESGAAEVRQVLGTAAAALGCAEASPLGPLGKGSRVPLLPGRWLWSRPLVQEGPEGQPVVTGVSPASEEPGGSLLVGGRVSVASDGSCRWQDWECHWC